MPNVKNASKRSPRNGGSIKGFNDSIFSTAKPSVYEMDKKKYGALLPKTGVFYLPDERIIQFLR